MFIFSSDKFFEAQEKIYKMMFVTHTRSIKWTLIILCTFGLSNLAKFAFVLMINLNDKLVTFITIKLNIKSDNQGKGC